MQKRLIITGIQNVHGCVRACVCVCVWQREREGGGREQFSISYDWCQLDWFGTHTKTPPHIHTHKVEISSADTCMQTWKWLQHCLEMDIHSDTNVQINNPAKTLQRRTSITDTDTANGEGARHRHEQPVKNQLNVSHKKWSSSKWTKHTQQRLINSDIEVSQLQELRSSLSFSGNQS